MSVHKYPTYLSGHHQPRGILTVSGLHQYASVTDAADAGMGLVGRSLVLLGFLSLIAY